MSKFITFDGVKYYNTDKISTIDVVQYEEKFKNSEYLFYKVHIDNELVFESVAFKTYEDGYKTSHGLENFNDSLNNVRNMIEKL